MGLNFYTLIYWYKPIVLLFQKKKKKPIVLISFALSIFNVYTFFSIKVVLFWSSKKRRLYFSGWLARQRVNEWSTTWHGHWLITIWNYEPIQCYNNATTLLPLTTLIGCSWNIILLGVLEKGNAVIFPFKFMFRFHRESNIRESVTP